jgi:hypothetical protein
MFIYDDSVHDCQIIRYMMKQEKSAERQKKKQAYLRNKTIKL